MVTNLPTRKYEEVPLADDPRKRLEMLKELLRTYKHDESSDGFFVEVDYHTPVHFHQKLDMAPLMTRAVGLEELSPYQRELVEQGFGGSLDSEKLVPDLGEHKEQMHALRLLQVMVREGVEITALHSVWTFAQSKWMKEYIDRLSQKRARTKDVTTNDVLKKAMNSLYGKMLQDKQGYRNVNAYTDSVLFAVSYTHLTLPTIYSV